MYYNIEDPVKRLHKALGLAVAVAVAVLVLLPKLRSDSISYPKCQTGLRFFLPHFVCFCSSSIINCYSKTTIIFPINVHRISSS